MPVPIDLARETDELLRLRAQDRQAHFGLDVDLILAHQGEPFVTVGNGRVDAASRDEVAAHFTRYFAGVEYAEWDDLEPPRIQISDDATLAWMIVRNGVRRSQTQPDGTVVQRQFVYAGLMGYAKRATLVPHRQCLHLRARLIPFLLFLYRFLSFFLFFSGTISPARAPIV